MWWLIGLPIALCRVFLRALDLRADPNSLLSMGLIIVALLIITCPLAYAAGRSVFWHRALFRLLCAIIAAINLDGKSGGAGVLNQALRCAGPSLFRFSEAP